MARGESPKERPLSIGLAIVAVVAVATLCALFSVVTSNHTPASSPYTPYAPAGPPEPFTGATASFATLSSRDSTRATLVAGGSLTRDPRAAAIALEGALRDRGYVVGATEASAPQVLPFDAIPPDLEGACGVVLLIGDVTTTLTAAGASGAPLLRAVDPSAFTVAACGTDPIRVEGSGAVTMRTWLMPGLTPSALASTGLSADALLAHAEAETLLRRRGYVPEGEIVETAGSATTAGGFVTATLPLVPPAGCVALALYVEGAGQPQLTPGRYDYLPDRALTGAVSCSDTTRSWEPVLVDDATVGARVFWRAYGASPTGASSTGLTIAGATMVDAAHATWPTAIATTP